VTGESVGPAYADRGDAAGETFDAVAGREIIPEVVEPPGAKRGPVLPPRRWVVGRWFGSMARSRRLARGCERPSEALAGLHHVAFGLPMLRKSAPLFAWSS